MAGLPPYSTYRTDPKQMMFPQATSHGNILTFTPPGLRQQLNVKFPDSRLAVCEKCKKNFKTRDMCRVRNTHTTAPWKTAYVCITIDDSCLDEHGQYIDQEMTVRMVQWQPYCVNKPFDSKTPVCAACKRTNRTRSFCRDRHKHRHLPWCTVYVLLSALESAEPSTVVAGPSVKVEDESNGVVCGNHDDIVPTEVETQGSQTASNNHSQEDGEVKSRPSPGGDHQDAIHHHNHISAGGGTLDSDTIDSDPKNHGDDIHDIPDSRTFLAKVSCRSASIHWLELADFETPEATAFGVAIGDGQQPYQASIPTTVVQVMDPSNPSAPYYGHGMGYAAQQHQNALKSRQQYFFQMQQQHQQQFGAGTLPTWQQQQQQQHPHYIIPPVPSQLDHGQSQPSSGATAGEAAAAQARQGQLQQQNPHHPHHPDEMPQWAMYYPHPAIMGHYPPPPPPISSSSSSTTPHGGVHGMVANGHGEQYHMSTEETGPNHDGNEEEEAQEEDDDHHQHNAEEPDHKRQRV